MGNKDIELQEDPSDTKTEKGVSPRQDDVDRPPTPPKKDYQSPKSSEKDAKRPSFLPRPEVIYKPESTKTCMTCLKNLFILFNLLIWLFGGVLLGMGIWIKVDKDFWDLQTGLDMRQFNTAASVMVAVGVFIMLVGFLGCYGAFSETIWMLVLYSIVVTLLIFLELAVAAIVWTASNNKELEDKIKEKARKAIQEMSLVEDQWYFLNLMQSKLRCCGIDKPDEYEKYGEIPRSCRDPDTGYPFVKGCLPTVIEYLKSKAAILGGIAVAVFILQLAAIIIAVVITVGLKQAVTNSIF